MDSMWSTGVNNFVWDEKKFPNATGMVDYMHEKGVRVILWATSMVNVDSPSYQEGKDKGYYLNGGKTIHWWHGHGSFIDYTNPAALKWWHGQMDNVIKGTGIDGWKCDGTGMVLEVLLIVDPFTFELLPYIEAHSGRITEREYADMYYRDFFYYTRQHNPDALISMLFGCC